MLDTVLKYKGIRLSRKLPSCILNIDDLKKLYDILAETVNEIVDFEINNLSPKPADMQDNAFEELKTNYRKALSLCIIVMGADGEQVVDDNADILDKRKLPEKIKSIAFDSSWGYKLFYNREPYNKITLFFDFTKPRVWDFSNPSIEPTPNKSGIDILGSNKTWVNGVYGMVMNYLANKKRRRDWLYSQFIYDALLFLIAIPLIFWSISKLDTWLHTQLHVLSGILRTGVYVWVFIAGLYIFRLVFNCTRRLYPLIEYTSPAITLRVSWGALLVTIFGTFIVDIIKNLIKLFI